MKASLQGFHKPTAKQLNSVSNAGVCPLFDEDNHGSMEENILLKKRSIAGTNDLNVVVDNIF